MIEIQQFWFRRREVGEVVGSMLNWHVLHGGRDDRVYGTYPPLYTFVGRVQIKKSPRDVVQTEVLNATIVQSIGIVPTVNAKCILVQIDDVNPLDVGIQPGQSRDGI